jgi:hypothetical protein
MKTFFRVSIACAGILASLSARGGVSFSSTATGSAWNGSPTYVSVPNASFATLTVAQGDPAITGANGILSEIFTPASGFTLDSFGLVMQVSFAGNYGIHLYDLGPANTVSVSSSAATYTPGADLFSGLSISLSTTPGSVQGLFTLSGADQVSLLANEQYALEIWTPSGNGQNGFLWYRSSLGTQLDPGGQMFSDGDDTQARKTLVGNGQAGGAPRTGGLAIYSVVPEPSVVTLIGLGGLALLIRRRK